MASKKATPADHGIWAARADNREAAAEAHRQADKRRAAQDRADQAAQDEIDADFPPAAGEPEYSDAEIAFMEATEQADPGPARPRHPKAANADIDALLACSVCGGAGTIAEPSTAAQIINRTCIWCSGTGDEPARHEDDDAVALAVGKAILAAAGLAMRRDIPVGKTINLEGIAREAYHLAGGELAEAPAAPAQHTKKLSNGTTMVCDGPGPVFDEDAEAEAARTGVRAMKVTPIEDSPKIKTYSHYRKDGRKTQVTIPENES